MNTGFVRPAVATVLTACGIETEQDILREVLRGDCIGLQQYLPLAVLKPLKIMKMMLMIQLTQLQQYLPLAVLKHR